MPSLLYFTQQLKLKKSDKMVNMKSSLSFGLPAAVPRLEDCADFGFSVSPYL